MVSMVRDKILAKIKPDKKEEEKVEEFGKRLLKVAQKVSGLSSVFVGSVGKGTWLKGDHDFDLFMLFHIDVDKKDLEKKGMEYGKRITSRMKGKWIIKYAEHPYIHANIEGFVVDLVPCYRIKMKEKIKSAVDRSPLHLEYIHTNLREDLRDDVRLLKQFCKGIGVYGSDTKIQGLSGYICELLVIKYGRFENVVRNIAKWSVPVVIDMENLVFSKDLGRKFPHHPLIMIDPTDSNRNAAANVCAENLIKLVEKSKEYTENPNEKFFFPPPTNTMNVKEIISLEKRGTKFIAIQMENLDIIDDILFPQLRRMQKNMSGMLERSDFKTIREFVFVNKNIYMIFEFETFSLPLINKLSGPPVFESGHAKKFSKRYEEEDATVYVEGNRWFVERKRLYREPEDFLNDLKKQEKKELINSGVPENLSGNFMKGRIIKHKDFLGLLVKDKELSKFVKEKYF